MILCLDASAFAETSENVIKMESGSDEGKFPVTARFSELSIQEMRDLTINYSDEFFTRDPNIFYLDLAQASFGMTISAFRENMDENAELDDDIRSFFNQAGFNNFESTWYDQEPNENSISSAVASKKIEDKTVIAFICAGAGYKDEWLSNFRVGTNLEHDGFSSAAALCEERLFDYIDRHNITGDICLWVSGFSRASAVGNCLAAHMIESGVFSSIYGYFFATPNNTRIPIAYENLFNIIGQNDPVPQIPMTSWGYGRYGRDLYTPAQETNSDYILCALGADDAEMSINGQSFRNNPAINRQLHVVFEYLTVIFPTVDDMATILQPQLISVYKQSGNGNMFVVLREALSNIDGGLNPSQQNAASSLVEYLDEVFYTYVSGNELQKDDGSWNEDVQMSSNIMLEHLPVVYASWLFSTDDPNELFKTSTSTHRIVIDGEFDLEVWDDAGIVQSISSNNEESVFLPGGEARPENAELIYLYASNNNGKAVVQLPGDNSYVIKLNILKNQTISLFDNQYSYGKWNNEVSDIVMFNAKSGDIILISDFEGANGMTVSLENGETVSCIRQEMGENTESIVAREQLMSKNFSVGNIINSSIVTVVIILVLLLVSLGLFVIWRNSYRAKTAVTICLTLISIVLGASAVNYSVLLPNIRIIPAFVSILAILLVAINALRYRNAGVSLLCLGLSVVGGINYYLLFQKNNSWINVLILVILLLTSNILLFISIRNRAKKDLIETV